MELRIKAARTTKDIDLTMRSVFSSGGKKHDRKNLAVLEKLQEAAAFSGVRSKPASMGAYSLDFT
jgi:hypothetical protein